MKNLYLKEWGFFKTHLVIPYGWLVFSCLWITGLVYLSFLNEPDSMEKALGFIQKALQEKGLLGWKEKSALWIAYKIFINNLQAALIFTVLGLVPFFLGAVLLVSSVSFLLGATLALTLSRGFEVWTFVKLTAPHGIPELLAVFYAASLGVFLSRQVTKKLFPKFREDTFPFSSLARQFLISYALLVLPLLALAALIESLVTPLLA